MCIQYNIAFLLAYGCINVQTNKSHIASYLATVDMISLLVCMHDFTVSLYNKNNIVCNQVYCTLTISSQQI